MNDYTRITSPSEPPTESNRRPLLMIGGCLALAACLACLGVIGLSGGIYLWQQVGEEWTGLAAATETAWEERYSAALAEASETAVATPTIAPATDTAVAADSPTPSPIPLPPSPTPTPPTGTAVPLAGLNPPPEIQDEPVPTRAFADLARLYSTNYPVNDYYETAVRLSTFKGPRTVEGTAYQVGDTRSFYNDTEELEAILVAVTEHTYFWVEEGLDLDPAAVMGAANQFEEAYYGRLTELFGQVWDPGVDNDPHLSILHVSGTAADELGYFNSEDEYPRALFHFSNEQEIIYLNMAELDLGEDLYYATLVHEVQHLIQWFVDPSETAWLNEGLSQLAEVVLGFTDTAETIDYLTSPETQLNTWAYEDDTVYAHYAGAYLFSVYLWEQLGDTAVQELSRHPANGMASVQAILQGFAPEMTLEQFTADWAAANFLDDSQADPRYYYRSLDFRQPAFHSKGNPDEPFELSASLEQFGVHYIDLREYEGLTTITFAGDTTAALIGTQPRNGDVFWYAPAVNDMNAHLTASFDLTNLNEATLTYSVWYDLEDDYDFAYISVSTDGGLTWETVAPNQSVRGDYGAAFNGRSAGKQGALEGWLKETVSLDAYAGQPVTIRFDVLTDSGITGQGFALDNMAISELGYTATFEDGPDGWQADGFVRTGRQLPQQWSVLLIEEGPAPTVTPLPLDVLNQGEWQVDLEEGGGVLVIMPQTPFVQEAANYWLQVSQ